MSKILFFITTLFFSHSAYSNVLLSKLYDDNKNVSVNMHKIKKIIKDMQFYIEQDEGDLIVKEAFDVLSLFYKKMIEIVAIHYGGIVIDARYSIEDLLFDLIQDSAQIIKLLLRYSLYIARSEQLTFNQKAKRCVTLFGGITVVGLLIKELFRLKNAQTRAPRIKDGGLS